MPSPRARLTNVVLLAAAGWMAGCGSSSPGPPSRGPGVSPLEAGAVADDSGDEGDAASSADGSASTVDAGTVQVICDTSSMDQLCTIRNVAAGNVMAMQTQCMQIGGTVVMSCPTAKLVGCCTEPDIEQCQYAPQYDPTSAPTGCMRLLGAWSTSQ